MNGLEKLYHENLRKKLGDDYYERALGVCAKFKGVIPKSIPKMLLFAADDPKVLEKMLRMFEDYDGKIEKKAVNRLIQTIYADVFGIDVRTRETVGAC